VEEEEEEEEEKVEEEEHSQALSIVKAQKHALSAWILDLHTHNTSTVMPK
jgi:succinylglutamate desuccinylase